MNNDNTIAFLPRLPGATMKAADGNLLALTGLETDQTVETTVDLLLAKTTSE